MQTSRRRSSSASSRSSTRSAVGCSISSTTVTVGEEDHPVGVRPAAAGSWVTITTVWPRSSTTAAQEAEHLGADGSRGCRWARRRRRSRVAGQRPGARDALLLAAGQLGRPVRRAGRAGRRCRRPSSSQRLVGLAAGEVHRERDVLQRGQRRHQVERLEDEADPVAAQLVSVLVVERVRSTSPIRRLPGGDRVEPGQAVHEGRLARAGRAHDRGEHDRRRSRR